mmetsp:Transcript_72801/g.236491  ORF Transcript_72801/g.236491 Transcript_72801/m.236491 type:complete len:273 (-) Transcript_72801:608-1426(-)
MVWRSSGPRPDLGMPKSLMMERIWGSIPMSSMRSASSKTKCLTASTLMTPRSRKSCRRPGVQIAISTPSASALSCGMVSAPPLMQATRISERKVSRRASTAICWHSSRVGASTKLVGQTGPSARALGPTRMAVAMIGVRNAAVLPLPVCALTMTSVHSRAAGMACFCTGVGVLYPHLSILATSASGKSYLSQAAMKLSTGCTSPLPPLRSTGMSSYFWKLLPAVTRRVLKISRSSRSQKRSSLGAAPLETTMRWKALNWLVSCCFLASRMSS